ncbi:MAG: ParB/RepB/Spo0J family partition protein [Pseudomonadota bacterium]
MSALSDKFAKGRQAVAERSADRLENAAATAEAQPPTRPSGPQHGNVTIMKMEMLKAENEALKAGMPSVLLDAREIRSSDWANRLPDSFNTPEFAAFKAEISSAGGNKQPIKVRPVADGGVVKFEIIFGHRRHRACLDLGIPVLAIVADLSDKDLFIEMERENRGREDLTPYEQGQMYASAIDGKLFPSIRKMAEEIGEDHSLVAKAIALARLPEPILDSFVSRLEIQYRWGATLKAAIEKEPEVILARASDIAKQRAGGNQVSSPQAFDILTGKSSSSSKRSTRKVTVGEHVLMITEGKNKLAFELPAVGRDKQSRIEKYITELLAE